MKPFKLTPFRLNSYKEELTKIEFTTHARSRWARLGKLIHNNKLHNNLIFGMIEYDEKHDKHKVNLINSDGILFVLNYDDNKLITVYEIKTNKLFALLKKVNAEFTKEINDLFALLKDNQRDSETVEHAKQMGYI